jgi:hypothetical protein
MRSGDQSRRAGDRVERPVPAARAPDLPRLPGCVRSAARNGGLSRERCSARGKSTTPATMGLRYAQRGSAVILPGWPDHSVARWSRHQVVRRARRRVDLALGGQRLVCQPALLLDHPDAQPSRCPRHRRVELARRRTPGFEGVEQVALDERRVGVGFTWAFSTAFPKSSGGLKASLRANDGCASHWSVRKLLGTLPELRQRHPAKSGPESPPLERVPTPHPAQPALLRGWRGTTTGRDPPRRSATRRAPR